MRAVWSFWSNPFFGFKGRIWREPHHHLLAWGLSLRLARQHYPIHLDTDVFLWRPLPATLAVLTRSARGQQYADWSGRQTTHRWCYLV
jgi:hypothetical protein